MKAIQTSAILTSISTRADGSLGLRLSTPELKSDEKLAFLEIHNCNVKLLIQPMDSPPEELVTVHNDLEQKTPSVRMRNCLFIAWKNEMEHTDNKMPFDKFYAERMESMIQKIKDTLPQPPF